MDPRIEIARIDRQIESLLSLRTGEVATAIFKAYQTEPAKDAFIAALIGRLIATASNQR